ncbi:acyl-[acyl-carrier-protein] thioesterase [Clostridium chrysemydis]|uniref:acyl-[acyl-carrier-protein] thioesterase n=1 Tax=Clostridium chrysemydis TaxID=2665504 RepID=UPI001883354F|nr:acyl-ACP thioesterase domain-containing protein [Clostridium chrysemydis]
MKNNDFSKEYEVMYRDSDYRLRCKLTAIADYFCEVGNIQAETIGDTIDFAYSHGCAWVFYKYDIKIHRYPKYREKIIVKTMPIGFKRFYAYRGYEIRSEEGELLAEGLALFFLINIERRRPMRILKEQYDMYGEEGDMKESLDMEKIEKLTREDNFKEFQIRYSDIDSNTHVNNVRYMEWAIESIPLEIAKNYELKRIKVAFEKESKYGDRIHVSAQIEEREDDLVTLHKICNSNGEELTLLEAHWDKINN